MKWGIFSVCLVLLPDYLAGNEVNPVQKVLSMLADLKSKVVADGKNDDLVHTNYSDFCVRVKRDIGYEIQTGKTTVEDLSATIAKASADIGSQSTRVEQLTSSITKSQASLASAADVHKKERTDLQASVVELKGAVDMLGQAIKLLSDKLKGKSASLLQEHVQVNDDGLIKALNAVVDAAGFQVADSTSLMSLIETATKQAPSVAAYTPKSSGIVDVLTEMKGKARSDLTDLEGQLSKSVHSFNMLQQSLQAQIAADQKELQQVNSVITDAQQQKATSEKNLQVSSKDLADDQAALSKYESSCAQADVDYEAAKKSRAEELAALDKAVTVLKEKTGNATSGVYGSTSFLQITDDSDLESPDDAARKFEIAQMVRELADHHHSSDLSKLASNIESLVQTRQAPGKDVFKQVIEMINGMVSNLKAQAAKEETKQAYCVDETKKTKSKFDQLKGKNDELQAKIDKKESDATTLKTEADTLAKELVALVKLQAEMDATRKQEREIFAKTKVDLTAGLEGVRLALQVLRDYYQGTKAGGALIQMDLDDEQPDPPSFGYSKSSGASEGIIGTLEVVESDFSRSLVTAENEESSKEDEYVKLTEQNKLSTTVKTADQEYKTQAAATITKELQEKISDKKAQQEELDAVVKYQKTLEEQCAPESGPSYEERVKAREEQMASLKDALAKLKGKTSFLQKEGGLRGMTIRKHKQ